MPFLPTIEPTTGHADRSAYGILGGRIAGGVTSVDDVLRVGDLNWEVETHPFASAITTPGEVIITEQGVTTIEPNTQVVGPKNKHLVVRRNPDGTRQALEAVVHKDYPPIQHRQIVELGQALVDSSDVSWSAAGHYRGGLKNFLQLDFPEGILIGGRDAVNLSLVLFGGHDGRSSVLGVPTATRLACSNQFPALQHSEVRFSIQHRGNVEIKLAEVRAAIGLTFQAAEEVQAIGDRLIAAPITSKEFLSFVDVIYPLARDKDGDVTGQSRNRQAEVRAIYETEADQASIRGTRWGALQAVIAYEDWHAVTRGDSETAHARRIVAHTADPIKQRATDLLLSGV